MLRFNSLVRVIQGLVLMSSAGRIFCGVRREESQIVASC